MSQSRKRLELGWLIPNFEGFLSKSNINLQSKRNSPFNMYNYSCLRVRSSRQQYRNMEKANVSQYHKFVTHKMADLRCTVVHVLVLYNLSST